MTTTAAPPAIDVSGVTKKFRGGVLALDDVALTVPRGRICGLLGPNGAGKSTLVKILTTLVRADSCRGVMLGYPIGHRETLRRVGYLPEHANLPTYLTGLEMVTYAGRLSGMPKRRARERAGELMERARISYAAKRRIGTYSKGMRQLIGICQALVHDPELIILDEPTDGVDPEGRQIIRDLIFELKDQGRTVFLNSHILAELEQMVDHLAIVSGGRVLRQGSMDELASPDVGVALTPRDPLPDGIVNAAVQRGWQVQGRALYFENPPESEVQSTLDELCRTGVVVQSLERESESLEAVFLRVVKEARATDELREKGGSK